MKESKQESLAQGSGDLITLATRISRELDRQLEVEVAHAGYTKQEFIMMAISAAIGKFRSKRTRRAS